LHHNEKRPTTILVVIDRSSRDGRIRTGDLLNPISVGPGGDANNHTILSREETAASGRPFRYRD
jgi:hypothetical protein